MDESVGLEDDNPTFGGLSASDFTSRVAGGEITAGDGLMDYGNYDGGYSHNIASISGEMLDDHSTLAGSVEGGDSGPNIRDRSTLFGPARYNSPATVKPERAFKPVVSSTLFI